jgi:hypothetical protein
MAAMGRHISTRPNDKEQRCPGSRIAWIQTYWQNWGDRPRPRPITYWLSEAVVIVRGRVNDHSPGVENHSDRQI